jgi:cytochrome P450 family 135
LRELPGGPGLPAPVQTVAFARDPVGVLLRCRTRYGPLFTLRFAGIGPVVVASTPDALSVVEGDPDRAHAGEARRAVLPQASERSMFGADEGTHQAVREEFAAPAHDAIAAIAEEHIACWPADRPFRVLSRLRTLMEDVFVRLVMQETGERAAAIVETMGRVLRTPGNPPLTPPDKNQAPPLGPAFHAAFERRIEPLRELLGDERTDRLLVVLAAAQEPPAIAHAWVLEQLARRPDERPLDALIKEVLRLRPPALASLRRLTEPVEIAGHTLAAGTDVMVSIPLLHRDRAVWKDPDEFRPERFLEADPPPTYIPFGGGRRRCPGEALAWAELETIVPLVLERRSLRHVWPRPERPVQRATVLVPHRSGLIRAAAKG